MKKTKDQYYTNIIKSKDSYFSIEITQTLFYL